MFDELPVRPEEQGADNNGGDPEVPLIPQSVPASADHRSTKIKTYPAAQYVYKTLRAVGMAIKWLWRHKPKAEFWIAGATVAMAITTGIYTHYARKQWEVIDNQLYRMGEANAYSRIVQSAFVDIPQEIKIWRTVEKDRVTFWTPSITMINNGSTGTYNTVEVVNVYVSDKEMPKDFDYPETGKWQNSDLGPHEKEFFDAQPIEIAAIQSIQNGGHVYIYGLAIYWNVFQFQADAKAKATYHKHLREFCYELRLDSRLCPESC